MRNKKSRGIALFAILALAVPTAVLGIGGSGSSYKTEQGGEMEFYENGQPKRIANGARCTGVKVVVQPTPQPKPAPEQPSSQDQSDRRDRPAAQSSARKVKITLAAAYGHIALQVPIDATIASFETFTDATLSTPLLIAGELVVWTPNAAIAAEAEAFAGPAQPGFAWKGFRTNPLLETVAGTFDQTFTWSASFDEGGYPDPGMIGTHSVAIYISDNAESVDPLVEWFTIY